MSLSIVEQLNQIASTQGADFFGVADLEQARGFMPIENSHMIDSYQYSISIGIRLIDDIVNLLQSPEDPAVILSYSRHAYEVVNQRLDIIASCIASVLQRNGYRAFPVPASLTIDQQRFYGAFSHKMGAHLAGLGWIGKNCLLITPTAGPRVRWATVLTDASLETKAEIMESRCGSCEACVNICPAGAIYGRAYSNEEHRDLRMDVNKCEAYRQAQAKKFGISVLCGLCLYACPFGRKRSSV